MKLAPVSCHVIDGEDIWASEAWVAGEFPAQGHQAEACCVSAHHMLPVLQNEICGPSVAPQPSLGAREDHTSAVGAFLMPCHAASLLQQILLNRIESTERGVVEAAERRGLTGEMSKAKVQYTTMHGHVRGTSKDK